MVFGTIFGEKCVRCGMTRTKSQFEGVPTCDDCKLEIDAKREHTRPCPNCNSAMAKEIIMNVIVDKCPKCRGVWFDGGELDLLKEAIEAGGGGDLATEMLTGIAVS